MIIQQQPDTAYNMGEILTFPVKITTLTGINDFLNINLLCNGQETNVHKEYIALESGEERQVIATIPLIKSFTTRNSGTCKLKSVLGEENILSKDFTILSAITIRILSKQTEFSPNEAITIEGEAVKSKGVSAQGFVEINLVTENNGSSQTITDTVVNGYFISNFTLPSNTKSGKYLARIRVYEKDSKNEITNEGEAENYFTITQIPTSLEIVFENSEVEPGETVKIKPLLRDQAGDKITSTANIIIKNNEGEILLQKDQPIEEFLDFPTEKTQAPEEFLVLADSNLLNCEETFLVKSHPEVEVTLINKTLTIKNVGNVFYNKSALVKIGEQIKEINVSLDLGEEESFVLSAPDGEYEIQVTSDGNTKLTQTATLTGNVVGIKKSGGLSGFFSSPLSWMFIIIILLIVVYIVYKKGYKKSFFGRMPSAQAFKKISSEKTFETKKEKFVMDASSKNKAELSLSIKGEKHPVSVVCLKWKNEIGNDSSVKESLQSILKIGEDEKTFVYENKDSFSFIFSPLKTKSFSTEINAVKFAENIDEILKEHNKKYKQVIDYGISVSYGNIIGKLESGVLKFMSLGTLMTSAKKIASIANQEILISDKMNQRVQKETKTQKQVRDNIPVYVLTEVKDSLKNAKFISSFLRRLDERK